MEGNDILNALLIPHPRMLGLYGLFRLTRYYNSIWARGMLSTVTVPLIDLTLQLECKTLDTVTPVWSRSQTKIMYPEEALAMYQLPGLRRKAGSITPIPKLKSVLKTFCEAHSIRKCVLFGRRQPGELVQAREVSWYSQKRVIHLSE